jgi:hypothetical protein
MTFTVTGSDDICHFFVLTINLGKLYIPEIFRNIKYIRYGLLFAIKHGDELIGLILLARSHLKRRKMLAILSQSLLVAVTMFGIVVLWQIITGFWG